MTKRDLYFALKCDMVGIGQGTSAVARVTIVNWDSEIVLDTFVKVPVPVLDYRQTGITAADMKSQQAMSFQQVRHKVESVLRGKILIGHRVDADLIALGLREELDIVAETDEEESGS